MRCDLHVHSKHSGPVTVPVLDRILSESCSEPGAVYDTARRRGMDLVTLTDHDTVAGALELAGRSDFFVSEEVTACCRKAGSCTWASSTSARRSTSRSFKERVWAEQMFARYRASRPAGFRAGTAGLGLSPSDAGAGGVRA